MIFNNISFNLGIKTNLLTMRKLLIILISCTIGILSCKNPKIKIDPDETVDLKEVNLADSSIIKIGIAAMQTPAEALPAYNDIVNYIGDHLNSEVEMVFTRDYTSMLQMIKEKKVYIGFVCSGVYVIGKDEWGMELIAAPVFNGETNYYSYIIIHKDDTFKSLEDLEGTKFAFTDPKSNTGTLVTKYELSKMGRNENNYFSEFIFSGSHDNSINAVAKKMVDGASVDNLIWDYMKNKNSDIVLQTKVIDKLGPFCSPPIVVHPDMNSSEKQKIKDIIINMHKDKVGKSILSSIYIDKYVIVNDTCYNSIRQMKKWVDKNIDPEE